MPSFLTPDFGLLFWMLIAFIVVFVILAKFGFPVIIKMVDERKKYIDESLKSAREANEKLANVKAESELMLKEARQKQSQIMKDAAATRDKIIREAKDRAVAEGNRIIDDARQQIIAEREKSLRQNREEVANLSIKIAGQVLSKNLQQDEQQVAWIDHLLDDLTVSK
ncbi:MAG: F0F1 ATP synthase subunit B [Bacteroidaceae bacterium]|jgi:F-type H+-transporting ATPase subunit b|nr:F0F1 ATP synthase subunit B [Bacteroidaceae bacterium]